MYMERDKSFQRATLFVNINFENIISILSNTTLTIKGKKGKVIPITGLCSPEGG